MFSATQARPLGIFLSESPALARVKEPYVEVACCSIVKLQETHNLQGMYVICSDISS